MPSQRAPRFWEWRPSPGQWAAIATAAIVLALVAWFAWQQGRLSGGYDSTVVDRERREARAQVEVLQRENARLNVQVAELEMARQLDREAYGQVEQTLAELQTQLSSQGGDLAFYRSIVSPADGIQGLRIHRFEVSPAAGPREFKLALTLIQAMRHESVASGLVQIALAGLTANRPARHTVGELLGPSPSAAAVLVPLLPDDRAECDPARGFRTARSRDRGPLEQAQVPGSTELSLEIAGSAPTLTGATAGLLDWLAE